MDTETHYANIERELLAIVYGCEKFHTYLYGRTFIMEMDHKPLEMISLKTSQWPMHASRGCSSICSSMTWSSHTGQAEKCFWQMPSATSHPEQTLRSSWISESMPYQCLPSPWDVWPRLVPRHNRTPSSWQCTDSPWMVGLTDKVMSPEQQNFTGASMTNSPLMVTSWPRVNEWSFHCPAETILWQTSMEAMLVSTKQWTWPEHVFTGLVWKQTWPTTSSSVWHALSAATYQLRHWNPTRSLLDLG